MFLLSLSLSLALIICILLLLFFILFRFNYKKSHLNKFVIHFHSFVCCFFFSLFSNFILLHIINLHQFAFIQIYSFRKIKYCNKRLFVVAVVVVWKWPTTQTEKTDFERKNKTKKHTTTESDIDFGLFFGVRI